MLTTPFCPREVKEQLYEALACFHQEWERGVSCATMFALCEATERADDALTRLHAQEPVEKAARLQTVQLSILLATAKQALEASLEEIGEAEPPSPVPARPEPTEAFFPAGTIIACPDCGEGLYKVTQEASTSTLVLDQGSVLVPLNQSIPLRTVWKPLACFLCGGRLFKDGQIHTFQYGWR